MSKDREERIEDIEKAVLNCLRNGGGDEIRRIFKESLNDMGLHKDDEQELRKDFNFLRLTRKYYGKYLYGGAFSVIVALILFSDEIKTALGG